MMTESGLALHTTDARAVHPIVLASTRAIGIIAANRSTYSSQKEDRQDTC
jgi:hypothetical protein